MQNLLLDLKLLLIQPILQGPSLTREIVLGSSKSGLYYATDCPVSQQSSTGSKILASVLTDKEKEEAKLWHLRLGHLPFNKLAYVVPTVESKSCCINSICQICPKAKQVRLSFNKSAIRSTRIFQLLHIDI